MKGLLLYWILFINYFISSSQILSSHLIQKRSPQSPENEVSLPLSITSWLYRFPPWFEPNNPPPPGLHLSTSSSEETHPEALTDNSEEKIILPESQPFNDEVVRTILNDKLDEVSLGDDRVVLEVVKENRTDELSGRHQFSQPFLASEALNGQFQPVVPNVAFNGVREREVLQRDLPIPAQDDETEPHIGFFIPIVPNDDFEVEKQTSQSTPVTRTSNQNFNPSNRESQQSLDSRAARKAIPDSLLPTSNLINVPKFPPLPLETSTSAHLTNEALLPLLKSKLSELLRIQESPRDIRIPSPRSVRFPDEVGPTFQGFDRPNSTPEEPLQAGRLSRSRDGVPLGAFNPSSIQDIITRIQDDKTLHVPFRPSPSIDESHPGSRWVWQS